MALFGRPTELLGRYRLLREIGHGAYGVVWSAKTLHGDGEIVAVKEVHNLYDFQIARRTLREIRLLRFLKHQNVINMRELIVVKPKEQFGSLYMVLPKMDADLHKIIYSNSPITPKHVELWMYQLLCGLKYMHSASVLHRDLKPKNILVNKDLNLKICDLGMGRAECCGPSLRMTMLEEVATPYYRAPEGIFLKDKAYDHSVDVWAVGCIFAELFLRRPIFPGKCNQELLTLFTDALGSPDAKMMDKYPNSKYKSIILDMPHKEGSGLAAMLPGWSAKALDLTKKMLVFNPEQRITVVDCLCHPYLEDWHDDSDEEECNQIFKEAEQVLGVEECKLDLTNLRDLIWQEVQFFAKKRRVEPITQDDAGNYITCA